MKETPYYIVTLNYFSVIFFSSGLYISYIASESTLAFLCVLISWIYLIPPLLARVTILLLGKPSGTVSNDSTTHFTWWLLFQYQLLFNRFSMLEEILRSIPGVYAIWLNLWGAKVSMYSFWSPGVTVLDRYNMHIQKGVILGTECLLSGHFLTLDDNGEYSMIIGEIHIKSNALIGTRAMVAPGCMIHENEILPATRMLMPFTELKNGKKIRNPEVSGT